MKKEPYAKEFLLADSLIDDAGAPQSAAKVVQGIYNKAKAAGQPVQMLKAQLYLMRTATQYAEGADTANIRTAVAEANTAPFPYSAVWHSIAAQLYWNYYQQHRWQILQRSTVLNEGKQPIEEWDAAHFFRVIAKHYDVSLEDETGLQTTDLKAFMPLLEGDAATRYLRPTLFDLLAFRAVDYYTNEEADLTRPANQFTVSDPAYLIAQPRAFLNLAITSKDTTSKQLHALRLYQLILDIHLNDDAPDALIDADLHRLKFVYDHATFPDKKALYKSALERLAGRYKDNPTAAEAGYRAIALQYEAPRIMRGQPQKSSTKTRDLVAIRAALKVIAARFPKSEGGVHAQQLINEIEQPVLSIQSEEAILPDENSKVLVTYKNVPEVWTTLIRLSPTDYEALLANENQVRQYDLLGRKGIRMEHFELPAAGDYETHTTELPVAPLGKGIYALLVRDQESLNTKERNISYVLFQVTDISMITQQGKIGGYVLHRKTGRPLPGAQLEFYAQEWKSGKNSQVKKAGAKSGTDGAFKAAEKQLSISRTIIRHGDEVFYADAGIYAYDYEQREKAATQTFFFTDRSIYRPGQTIYFKGIAVQKNPDAAKTGVLAKGTTKVSFTDANGQLIKALTLERNEFGSFTGSFAAPSGGLTGSMSISDQWGSTEISVEEYKRPKYEVTFDTLKSSYALNKLVTLTGAANTYAGSVVDGATVKYRVVRETRWPYPWLYGRMIAPAGDDREITSGVVETNAQGKFRISFKALPDETVDTALLPKFTYTVYADVTDAAGETRSATQYVTAGYRGIEIAAAIPQKATAGQLKMLSVSIRNLNGQPLVQDAAITIAPLNAPEKILRGRLWPMPDAYVLDEATFRQQFPLDEYRDESKPDTWKAGTAIYQQAFTSNEKGELAIPANTFKSGWYVIMIRAKDKSSGAFVEDKHFIEVVGGRPTAPLTATLDKPAYEPGQTAKATIVSGFADAYVIQEAAFTDHKTEITQKLLDGKAQSWSRNITEADRGGIALQWLMVKDNRVYTASETVSIPWSNKDLSVTWATHRDKLEPGAKEKWTVTIKGAKKEQVAAELMAGLYDASLDALKPHSWSIDGLFSMTPALRGWDKEGGFGMAYNRVIAVAAMPVVATVDKEYEHLLTDEEEQEMYRGRMYKSGRGGVMMAAASAPAPPPAAPSVKFTPPGLLLADASVTETTAIEQDHVLKPAKDIPLRKNLQETAFFFPQLKTDAAGNVSFAFTMPEALTEWKFMALAHTKGMATGQLTGTVKTQKDLMVQPNLPRFLRQGDDMVLTTKIANLSAAALSGSATLEIADAQTGLAAGKAFRVAQETVPFTAAKGQSTTASWRIHIPESRYEPVLIRISAQAGNFTDGEENMLPVLTNRTLVTETLPLWMNGAGTKNFTFEKLLLSDTSRTLAQHRLTVEYTANPAWYAVQALPYLMEYPYECAEQTFNRYYAHALAAHILDKAPRVKEIFAQWKSRDTGALKSNLQKNEELKSALLEETPWVLEAKDEAAQKRNIAQLFDAYKLGAVQESTLKKLDELMLPEGAFPWFKGSSPDRYITQYIATGLARLQRLGIDNKGAVALQQKAEAFLDRSIAADYQNLVKAKARMEEQQIGYAQIQYLYGKSFDAGKVQQDSAITYYRKQAARYWPKYNAYMKGMIALALYRSGDKATAQNIIQSLRETAIHKEELGMYWMQPGAGYRWYEAPIEAQALLIECFSEAAKDVAATDELKRWLLKQKQTQNWSTTKATADACYALLLNGTQWLSNMPTVSIKLGDQSITPNKTEAGTGYFRQAFAEGALKPAMGNITLTTSGNNQASSTAVGPSYGAVYWQYFEDYDKITSAATPLALRRQLFKETNTPNGPVLEEIGEGAKLKVGDKVKIRIVLQADRDMEYLHLKDTRAALFEPVNALSGYRWQGGLGYYESTRDASSNFFISYLQKGTYVFEYAVNVMARGDCSNGIATIQCMYAPEFTSHSAGIRVSVE